MGQEENREGLKLDMLMEDKKEEGKIAKERGKEIRKYLIQIWENKKTKKKKKKNKREQEKVDMKHSGED